MHGPVVQGESPDIDRMIEASGCSKQYFALEECMGENDRVWSKCQKEVKELSACNKEQAKKTSR